MTEKRSLDRLLSFLGNRLFLLVEWGLIVGAVRFAAELSGSVAVQILGYALWAALLAKALLSAQEAARLTASAFGLPPSPFPTHVRDVKFVHLVIILIYPFFLGSMAAGVILFVWQLSELGRILAN